MFMGRSLVGRAAGDGSGSGIVAAWPGSRLWSSDHMQAAVRQGAAASDRWGQARQ